MSKSQLLCIIGDIGKIAANNYSFAKFNHRDNRGFSFADGLSTYLRIKQWLVIKVLGNWKIVFIYEFIPPIFN